MPAHTPSFRRVRWVPEGLFLARNDLLQRAPGNPGHRILLLVLLLCAGSGCTELRSGYHFTAAASDRHPDDAAIDSRWDSGDGEPPRFEDGFGSDDVDDAAGHFIVANVEHPLTADFDLADFSDDWDRVERYELALGYHSERDIQIQPIGSVYGYFDKRRWRQGAAKVSLDSAGLGVEVGALLYPLTHQAGHAIDVAFHPYLRYGLGTAGGRVKDVPVFTALGPGTSSGDAGDWRTEYGFGADLRLLFGEHFLVSAGAGTRWWHSFDSRLVSVHSGSGVVVDIDDSDFDGRDTYARFVIEIGY